MSRYKTMVVGMGKRGKHHAFGFHANDRFEVAGICDVIPDALPGLAQQLGGAMYGTDAAAMAAEIKPDVFCFCTHPNLRYDLVELGVNAGARLIAFEKPLAMTSAEAVRIKKLLDVSGTRAVVSHQRPSTRKIRCAWAPGARGTHTRTFPTRQPSPSRVQASRPSAESQTSRALRGPDPLDPIRFQSRTPSGRLSVPPSA